MSPRPIPLSIRPVPRFSLVLQTHPRDCGLSCLRMILRHYDQDRDLSTPPFTAHLDSRGMSLAALVAVARELGLRCEALRGSFEEFEAEVQLPCIVHWQENHWMVVHALDAEGVHIANPALGFEFLSRAEFCEGWASMDDDGSPRGTVLALAPPESGALESGDEEPDEPGVEVSRYRTLGGELSPRPRGGVPTSR